MGELYWDLKEVISRVEGRLVEVYSYLVVKGTDSAEEGKTENQFLTCIPGFYDLVIDYEV